MIDKTGLIYGFNMYCDCCSESEFFDFEHDQFLEMIAEAKRRGWTMKKKDDQWEHICPACSKLEPGKDDMNTRQDALDLADSVEGG